MFNCNGLIWLASLHVDVANEDQINFFAGPCIQFTHELQQMHRKQTKNW